MGWMLRRVAAVLACMLAGAAAAHWLSQRFGAPPWASLLGAGLGVALAAGFDALLGQRLVHWLRGEQQGPAPRDGGLWGELGYRIERAIRLRERATAHERDRLAQFLSAIEASPNGVMLLDADDQIVWCNHMAAEHFGLDPQRDLRQRITNLVRMPAFVEHLQAGDFDHAIVLPQVRDKATLSVAVRGYGEAMKLVLSQDITERERAETMRRDFVANVSHEIRTPLTVLAGFIETLRDLPLAEAERQRVLDLMAQQARRMDTLVGDLLTLAQLESSPPPPNDQWVPVARLLEVVETDARTLSAGRHELRVGAAGAAEVAGSETELLSALANLVSNAVRYTPPGGRVEVLWHARPDGAGELLVQDTGIGIAKEHLARLTERFYRVDGSRSRESGGTGLGLSIVKHVVQRHGGELQVHSEPGQGSRFCIVLPAWRVRGLQRPEG
ncbi:phosphate regulon sensor histidine kinase PhoR [Caldimonas thermodepolymerans]|uniref:Phosphate regulon sensor protein PhoR n=2 Tax=Caldimonas thermodepolymerans TaxID=215580 RepID=A0A2S5T7J6_9BURK|nr:phosphate regulon sensor histidine kinase PhoR [Caldimonas thermodepolymerans]QPC33068.1 phosphate regulon sensor histidine kinase PhoR [Caldimonas thermodepolymerans]RDI03856.1 two-component system phosphate regulon sensor histidine kinase PhoR [Caldimonas thermodepolymerans]